MDPISAGLSIVGAGLQIWSNFASAGKAHEISQQQQAIASDEQDINEQKRMQMQLEAHRMQLQQFRNIQRQRALGTAAAVNQGAQFGSGLQGGLAQITDQGQENVLGINQNLQIGQNIFGINNDISAHKQKIASLGGDMATDQAWGSLGGALVKNSGTIGSLGKDAYSAASSAFSLFSPGSLSGGLGRT